ncbi:MAG: hypothetical protein WC307_06495 [Candidatus Nanoarchaeia archaeon]|jgi:hypothetical protein
MIEEQMVKIEVLKKPEIIYEDVVSEAIISVNGKRVTVQRGNAFKDGCDLEVDDNLIGAESLTDEEHDALMDEVYGMKWK